jgi:hypothetical protein
MSGRIAVNHRNERQKRPSTLVPIDENADIIVHDNRAPDVHLTCSTRALSDDTLDAKLLRDNYRRLLPNDERSRVRVRADVARADGHVRDLESLDAINVQARVDDTARFRGFIAQVPS